jgi:EAL domain-containing protein (putative c-di-GMP-specific phosphodiesterase class I)
MRFFDPMMQEAINVRAELERGLHQALNQNEFQLYYQVQVNSTGLAFGAEALIRWIHPQKGLISPIEFISLAEETGLILSIGRWVLETACMQLKSWEADSITRGLTISVNVSAKQFNQPDFVAQVQTTVQRYAINPTLLKLELTESMLADDIGRSIINMVALQAIGVRFELDDFGTGYSSLQYLKQLPISQLKIDQSFVHDIANESSDQAIVQTIVAMAKSLNLDVIAEGVETQEQQQLLMENGCLRFQGYLFGRPMPIDQFEAGLK